MEYPRTWDNINRYKLSNLTKLVHSLVSICPIYGLWDSTALLFARLQDTETGKEEE